MDIKGTSFIISKRLGVFFVCLFFYHSKVFTMLRPTLPLPSEEIINQNSHQISEQGFLFFFSSRKSCLTFLYFVFGNCCCTCEESALQTIVYICASMSIQFSFSFSVPNFKHFQKFKRENSTCNVM